MSLKGFSGRIPGGGRTIALVILVLATSISFALGLFVGRSTAPTRTVANVVKVPAPAKEVRKQPAIVIVDAPLEVRTATNPSPPKRMKKASSPTPKAAPASAHEKKPPAETRYSVQVGAFEALMDAEKTRKKFKAKGYDSFVLRTGEGGDKAVFKVRIGEFIDSDAARLLSVKLKSIEGIAAFVVTSD